MSEKQFRFDMLMDITQDRYGLWEIAAGANSELPEFSDTARKSAAERFVRDLLARGWVELVEQNVDEGSERHVPSEEVDAVLATELLWDPIRARATSRKILVHITEKGKRETRRGVEIDF